MKRFFLFVASICGSWSFLGCGTGSPTTPPPAPIATHLSVTTANASPAIATAFNFTVNALDESNALVSNYAGTVHFTSSDGLAVLPPDSKLTNGAGIFPATLKTPGTQFITATDTVTASVFGTSNSINITAPLAITSSSPPGGTVGVQYGPSTTQYSECVLSPAAGHVVCTPCDPARCGYLPICGRGNRQGDPFKPCLSKQQVFTGFPLVATGGVPPYTWSWTPAANSSLPPGLSLKNGLIAGGSEYPTVAGTYDVTVTVTDVGSPASQKSASYLILIAPPPFLTITSGPPPDGTLGALYGGSSTGFHLSTAGGLPPYAWGWVAAAGSKLPPGLAFSSSGVISGTPSTTTAGSYNVIVTASDSETPVMQAKANYTITILTPPSPTINTTSPPAIGTLNVAYVGFTFSATGGVPPLTWSETGALPPGFLPLSSDGVLSGTPTAAGSFPITVEVQDALGHTSTPQDFNILVVTNGFTPTGSMQTPRVWHAATVFRNGLVLITGGVNATTFPVTTEIYDPVKGTFTNTLGSMSSVRSSPTATLLAGEKVLVAGGKDASGNPIASAELYDSGTQTFSLTFGNLTTPRVYHTATRLTDGTVLITGGLDLTGRPVMTAELFDPNTKTFSSVGNMATARFLHAATLLASGEVLVTGGLDLSAAELYDPVNKTFTPTGNMTVVRAGHTATTLTNGKVLLTGGASQFEGISTLSAELFDPATETFTATGNMVTARSLHTATLRNDGTVLVAGGDSYFYNGVLGQTLSAAELFDPVTDTFSAIADMTTPRESHAATLLLNGKVLVVGGSIGTLGYSAATTVLATAELY
jgi:hypothetical protein